ncbi:MAG: FAD binding domain-containing protein [Alphaproteobacteria bacterium]
MRLPELELASPATLAEACQFLEAGSDAALVLAGGTDLLVALKEGQKHPATLVDLASVPGLDEITYSDENGLEMGALVTLRQLGNDPIINRHFPVLAQTAEQVGTVQLQSAATVGGNLCQDSCCMYFNRPEEVRRPLPPCHKLGGCICHVVPTSDTCWAPYAGDMAPVLMALGATVDVADRNGETNRPLAEIFSQDGARPITLEAGQLIARIRCPAPGRCSGATYYKLRPRATLDYAVVGVAASLTLDPENVTCTDAAVVLTGVASSPQAVEEAGELVGASMTDEAIGRITEAAAKLSYPVTNVVGSEPGYRRGMVKVKVEAALREAHRIAMASLENRT